MRERREWINISARRITRSNFKIECFDEKWNGGWKCAAAARAIMLNAFKCLTFVGLFLSRVRLGVKYISIRELIEKFELLAPTIIT